MASAGTINVNLNANISQFQSSMRKASETIEKFSYSMNGKITEGLVDPLKKAKIEFKDVGRIVGGIVISKIFYGALNSIRRATDAVQEFKRELEYTETAFSNLFGSRELAEEFTNVLKDFSAVSPFDFKDSADAAQRLLAYGIKAKNVMYVMQGVMNAATIQGDPAKIESISRALGQIYTKGTLKAEELRQLAEAGIPAYEILAEKLNLDADAMKNIGNAAIPASQAINALVDGINERFSGMAQASTMTMKGMLSNIKDNALLLASGAFEPLYQQIRTLTRDLGVMLNTMYQIYELKGFGGVFEYLVPDPKDQIMYRQFISLVQELGLILGDVGNNIRLILVASLKQLIVIINAIGPYILAVAQIIQLVVREIRQCEPLMKLLTITLSAAAGGWIIFKTAALGALILKPLTKVILYCAKAVGILATAVTAHPLILGLVLLGAAIAALASTSTKAGEAVRNLGVSLTKFLGIDPGKKILPDTRQRTADINKFNEALDGTTDKLDATGDAAQEAAKKAKSAQKDLLSFDEVFRLNETKDETTGLDPTVPDYSNFDWGEGDMAIAEPVLPDFTELWDNAFQKQLDKLKEYGKKLWQKVCDVMGISNPDTALFTTAFAAGISAIAAALMGASLWQVVLAALAGAVAGLLWESIANAFGLEGEKRHEAQICTAFGAAFGALCAAILGFSPLGIILTALGSGLAAEIWSGIADAMGLTPNAKYSSLIAMGIASVLGAAFADPVIFSMISALTPNLAKAMGAAFGGATKGAALLNTASTAVLAGAWIAAFVQGIETGDWSGLVPAVVGTIARILFGPLMAIGGVIAGYLFNATFKGIQEKFGIDSMYRIRDEIVAAFNGMISGLASFFIPVITPLGTSIGVATTKALVNGLKGGIAGIITSLLSSALTNKMIEWMGEGLDLTKEDIENGKTGGEIGGLIGSLVGAIIGFCVGGPAGAMLGATIGNFLGQPIGGAIGALWDGYIWPALEGLGEDVEYFVTEMIPEFFDWVVDGLDEFFTETLPDAWDTGIDAIGTFFSETLPHAIGEGIGFIAGFIAKKIYNIYEVLHEFFTVTIPNAFDAFINWLCGIPDAIAQWFTSLIESISQWFTGVVNSVVWFFTVTLPEAFNNFLLWLQSLPETIATWFTSFIESLGIWLTETANSVIEFFTVTIPNAFLDFINWLITLPERLYELAVNIWEGFLQGLKDAWQAVKDWCAEIVDGFVEGFAEGWEIASPSKLFERIGGFVVEGLYNGLSNAWASVTEWVTGAVTTFVDFFGGLGDTISNWATSAWNTISGWVTNTSASFGSWIWNTAAGIGNWAQSAIQSIGTWASQTGDKIAGWIWNTAAGFGEWFHSVKEGLKSWIDEFVNRFQNDWWSKTVLMIQNFWHTGINKFKDFFDTTKSKLKEWASAFKQGISEAMENAKSKVSSAIQGMQSTISSFASSAQSLLSRVASAVSSAASKVKSAVSSALSSSASLTNAKARSVSLRGHATGGIFNREHIAHIAEGNKAEAIIPLQDKTAMQPFVDAVSSGLAQYLGPVMANMNNGSSNEPMVAAADNSLPPLYVGTLIADESSLRELQRKLNVIQLHETRRTI